ncbi:MAG: diphthine synthase [Candidatus Aenigmarchaeota archaeon]|nr:diphthine synthase [Candidatus Aenigmarchaeota archaeon]
MLTIVGLGLWDEEDISLKGLEAVKSADAVYAELYTNLWDGNIKNLEKLAGGKIIVLARKDVEDGSAGILSEAKSRSVCLLVPGDPLAATTHADLILQAKKAGVGTTIIHASSIFTAIAECGLQLYKFGKTATLPLKEKTGGVAPNSVYETIKGNLSIGLHTLLLLDIDAENGKNLGVEDALGVLRKLDSDKILSDRKIVAMSLLGSGKQRISYGRADELAGDKFALPAVLIVPGKLHFAEREFLETFSFK